MCKRVPASQRQIIEIEAGAADVDADLVEAMAIVENGSSTLQRNDTIVAGVNWDVNRYAHGLMQVGLVQAKEAGYKPTDEATDSHGNAYSPALASDLNSIRYGVKYLALNARRPKNQCNFRDYDCMASSYNAGTARNASGGLRASGYAAKVRAALACVKNQPLEDFVGPPAPTTPPPPGGVTPESGGFSCASYNPNLDTIIPFPMPSNPYFAYFTVNLLGTDLGGQNPEIAAQQGKDLAPDRPQYVTYFEFTIRMGASIESHVRIFDPNWDTVEGALDPTLRSQDEGFVPNAWTNSAVSFGYAPRTAESVTPFTEQPEELWSKPYYVRLMSYHPEFLGYGVEMELFFIGVDVLDSATSARSKVWKHKRIATGDVNDPEGPGMIEDWAVNEKGWNVCAARTTSMTETGAGLSSVEPAPVCHIQDNTTDFAFFTRMTEVAALDDVTGPDGKPNQGGCMMRHDATNNTLCFHPPIGMYPGVPYAREYTYGRQQYGAVISFKPNVNGAAMAQFGAGETVVDFLDTGRKKFEQVVLNQENNPESFVTGPNVSDGTAPGNPTGAQAGERKPMRRYFNTPFQNVDTAYVEGLSMWQSARYFVMDAELVIIGDPLIQPGWSVKVMVQTYRMDEDGNIHPRIHYTSGIWVVHEARHIIQGGQYITILQLLRNDAIEGGIPIEAESQQRSFQGDSGVMDSANSAFTDNFPNNSVLL